MNTNMVTNLKDRISAQEWAMRIWSGLRAQAAEVAKGLGGLLARPALLRKLDRLDNTLRS